MGTNPSIEMTPQVKRGVVAWIAKAVFGLLLFVAVLFLPAGRWDWVWGWEKHIAYCVFRSPRYAIRSTQHAPRP